MLSDRPLPLEQQGRVRWLSPRETLSLVQALLLFFFTGTLVLLVVAHVGFDGDGSCLREQLKLQHGLSHDVVDAALFRANASLYPPHPFLSDDVVLLWAFPNSADHAAQAAQATAAAPGDKLRALVVDKGFAPASTEDNQLIVVPLSSQGGADGSQASNANKHHFEFSPDPAFILMGADLRVAHGVRTLNLTLPPSCLGSWPFRLAHSLLGNDEIIVNQFMHGLKSDGVLRNVQSHEMWAWNLSNPFSWLKYERWRPARILLNLSALWRAVVALLLISCMTALIVRILISSGVVIMFPVFYFLRQLGYLNADVRLIGMAYPWLGSEIEVLTESRQPTAPLIRSHLISVVITYSAYEACQFAWRRWVYGFKPLPQGVEMRVFALLMFVEYFLLVYARDAMTIRYLPRLLCGALVIFHVYIFAVPYAFASAASWMLWEFCVFWMAFFVLECESKALRRGTVSIDNPRAFFTLLPSPQWLTALPPIWSVFHELNRAVPAADAPPPPPPAPPPAAAAAPPAGAMATASDEMGLVRRGRRPTEEA